jgi:predicted Zn-dependent protease
MLLIRDPGNHLARVDYARLLIALGEFLDASEEVAKLPPRIKDSSRAQFLQVQIDLGRGAREAAADRTKDLLARFPGNPFLMLLAADVERVSGHPDRALEYCRRARSIIPQDLAPVLAEVNLLRQIGKGLSDGVAVLAAYKNKFGETPLLLNCEALIFLENGRTLQALKTAERSTLVDPNYGPTRYLVARVLSASKESEAKVVGALEEAIKLDPSQPEPYNMLADLYLKKGDADRAEATYQRLLDLRPDDPVIANNLASLYLDRGRVKEALTLAWTAYVGASKNAYVLDTLGWALHLSGRPKEAQRFLAEAVSRLPENPPVLLHWGLNLRVRAKASESDDVLKRLLKVAPQSPEAARAAQALKG